MAEVAQSDRPVADPEARREPPHSLSPWLPSALIAVASSLVALLIMCIDSPLRISVPVGGSACLISVVAILIAWQRRRDAGELANTVPNDANGANGANPTADDTASASDGDESALRAPRASDSSVSAAAADITLPLVWLVLSIVVLVAVTSLAVSGVFARLPGLGLSAELRQGLVAGSLVSLASLWVGIELFHTLQRLGVYDEKPLKRRSGFWLLALSVLLYLPMLGNFALIDPWETHYGEVAREMVTRKDWISMWWAHDGWFFSKPVLNFWMQALAFSLFGVKVGAGQMVAGVTAGLIPQPEWAARLPLALATIAAGYAVYRMVRWLTSERVGFLSALMLTSMPYWFFLGHQTMADMPYVAPMTVGMLLLLCALLTDEQQTLRCYEARLFGRRLRVEAWHWVMGTVLMLALPQILYLVSRNLTLHLFAEDVGFRLHTDELMAGSPGNCRLSGNEDCHLVQRIAFKHYQPALLAAGWAAGTGFFLWLNRDERRTQRLLYIGGWLCITLAFMAKAAPALVLPLAVYVGHLVVTRRSAQAKHGEWANLLILLAILSGPWLVQMYVRHGFPFIDRLFVHDIVKRAFEHVHDTNDGVDTSLRYYVWQLGYGLFPWSGLAVAGLLWWGRAAGRDAPNRQFHLVVFCALWFIAGFGMFTISNTKFHHYALPLVPPVAILGALVLDHALGKDPLTERRHIVPYLLGLTLGVALLVVGVSELRPGSLFGAVPGGSLPAARPLLGGLLITGGIAVAALSSWRWARRPTTPGTSDIASSSALGFVGLVTAVGALLVGRDLFTSNTADVAGPLRLYHLFCYNYSRPWPDVLSFEAAILGFTAAATLSAVLLVVRCARRHAVALLSITACLWTLWALDVYFVRIAPHFSQRANMIVYYRERAGPHEPLIAYQMNWKGENFYTSNHIETWTKTGSKFKDWVNEQKQAGVTTMFITTEHSRINTLKRELSQPKNFEQLTDKSFDNKFFVAKVSFEPGE